MTSRHSTVCLERRTRSAGRPTAAALPCIESWLQPSLRVARALPLTLLIGLAFATAAQASEGSGSSAFDLHKRGQHESAARRGLSDLLSQPWNHQLRFVVADSLERSGRLDEAATQLEALDGTPFAETARARLQTLRAARQPVPPQTQSPLPPSQSTYQPTHLVRTGTPPPVPAAVAPLVSPSGLAAAPLPAQSQYVSPSGDLAAGTGARPTAPATPTAARSPAAQRIADLNDAEKYAQAGTEGLALLSAEKADDDIRLIIANSLAWTGRLNEAISVYQGLLDGRLSNEARIGMANAYRWSGRDRKSVV